MSLKLVSWNVNGIRAIVKKGFLESVADMSPDIICLQETKAQLEDAQTALSLLPEYKSFINYSKARKGYSGTAILTKSEPINVTQDMGIEEHDQEGRIVTAEFEDFYLLTWDVAFLDYMKSLEAKKPLIVCGDLNVAHEDIDIARGKQNYNKSAGYTQKEIDGLERYLSHGWVDSFRKLYPEEVKYSYWNQMFKSRERNVGWRIDYFLVSDQIMPKVKDAAIYNEYYGSDHCPVAIELMV